MKCVFERINRGKFLTGTSVGNFTGSVPQRTALKRRPRDFDQENSYLM